MAQREQQIHEALQELRTNSDQSIRSVAKAFNISQSTLTRRFNGRQTNRATAHTTEQRLTPSQEQFLEDWIIEQVSQGYPPSPARTREMAERLLVAMDDHRPLGKDWVHSFKRRNPAVTSLIGRRRRRAEGARLNESTQEAIRDFYNEFEELFRKCKAGPAPAAA
ncbi:hypothetical protein MBLNU459_g7508t1 [Dothideomycetes sp. NU459]